MKKIKVKNENKKVISNIPKGSFASDWYLCRRCGSQMKLNSYANNAICPVCGGLMIRQ